MEASKQSLEGQKRMYGNALVALKEGMFKGELCQAVPELQNFFGGIFNELHAKLEGMNEPAQPQVSNDKPAAAKSKTTRKRTAVKRASN